MDLNRRIERLERALNPSDAIDPDSITYADGTPINGICWHDDNYTLRLPWTNCPKCVAVHRKVLQKGNVEPCSYYPDCPVCHPPQER